jgi:hypothetical protein
METSMLREQRPQDCGARNPNESGRHEGARCLLLDQV